MLTIREQLESLETSIEKVKNSQEYRIASQSNRLAMLKDLQSEREYLLSQISSESDLDKTLVQIEIEKKSQGRRSYIGFE